MKTTPLLVLSFLFIFSSAFTQHPLVGTWEMVSMKGTNANDEPFFRDTTSTREVKIITPTHYMLMAFDVEGDSLVFNRAYAGTIKLNGNHYFEDPKISSLPIFDNVKQDFTWKRHDDTFIQSGTFTRPDGKVVKLDELVFTLAKTENRYDENPAIGTWRQLSSSYTGFDGVKESHTNKAATRLHIITPTHWMRISHRDKKFENAMGGSYTMKDGKSYPVIEYSSFDASAFQNIEITERVEGNKLYVSGTAFSSDGKKFTWEDVFERAK